VNALFRGLNSLFGREKYPVPDEQGIACNVLELLVNLHHEPPKRSKNPEHSLLFSLFSVRHRALPVFNNLLSC
jgi:hypothetical protein